jgi:hypothetical protein
MSNESTGNSPAPPRCPSCAQPMQLIKEHRDLTDCQSYLLFHAEYVA